MDVQLNSEKRKKTYRLIAIFLVVAIVAAMIPIITMSATASGTEITAFEGETNLGTKTVEQGAAKDKLGLPKTLNVTLSDGTQTSVEVTWSGYDLDIPGSYITTPSIEGYTCSVPLPYYVVSVVGSDNSSDILERDIPHLDYVAVEENRELLDYYLSPVVRVLVPVDMTDKTFKQAVPTEDDNPNDTFYRFGYNAPENAETLYNSDEIAVYTAYASPMEYPDRVVVTYRVFGSVDGGTNAWYVCDENGSITHRVEERQVEWDLTGFDILVPDEYKITGSVASLTGEETPLQAELDISVSEVPEIPELEDECC